MLLGTLDNLMNRNKERVYASIVSYMGCHCGFVFTNLDQGVKVANVLVRKHYLPHINRLTRLAST